MQRHNDTKGKNIENTTESGFGEMIYMEPNGNQMISSPVTEGRQTVGGGATSTRSPSGGVGRSIVATVHNELSERNDTAQLVNQRPIRSIAIPFGSRGNSDDRVERSPKTINIGDSEAQTRYNITTLNARRSPKGVGQYQTYTNVPEQGNLALDQPMNYGSFMGVEAQSYQVGNDSNVMVTSMGGNIKSQSMLQGHNAKDVTYVMNPRDGREPLQTINKMSPNKNIDEINASGDKGYDSQSKLNDLKSGLGKNVAVYNVGDQMVPDNTQYRNDINQLGEILGSRSNPMKEGYSEGEIKKLVKKITKVYDPKKTKEGALISENQTIIPGANDEIFNDRYKVLQKMNKLSTILLAKKQGPRDTLNSSLNGSIEEPSRKTFDRQTLSRSDMKGSKIPLRRSPEQKFLYVSLAMLSSKGRNCEDRTILRKMRFDKGGVVDLAQEEAKKGKYNVKKVHRRQKAGGSKVVFKPNPKYREKAAKIVQQWWRELKDRYKKILEKIILIQSVVRGKWVRKYMYDVLYLTLMYQSFCQIIQKVLTRKAREYFFDKLNEGRENMLEALRRLLLKDERFKLLRIRPYWNRWLNLCKSYRKRALKSRRVVDIRAKNDANLSMMLRAFSKWRFLNGIRRALDKQNEGENQKRKFFGLVTLINGSDKSAKRNELKATKPKILHYLDDQIRQRAVTSLLHANPKFKNILKRNYWNKWKDQVHKLQMKGMRDKIFDGVLGGLGTKMKQKLMRRYLQLWLRNLPKNTDIDFYNGSMILQRAVWRMTHEDPLHALKEKEDSNALQDNIMRLLGVKSRYIKYHWRDYLMKWRNQAQKMKDAEVKNRLYLSLLDTMFKKRKNRILSNRFSHWRKVPQINMADIFERFKSMIDITRKLVRKSLVPHKQEFMEKLKKCVNPKAYKKAVDVLLEKYLNGNKNWQRYILYEWRDKCRNIEIYDLKIKLLQAQGGRNEGKNRKLLLSRRFNKWKVNTIADMLEDKKRERDRQRDALLAKESGARLLKNLRVHLDKNDKDRQKKNVFNKLREVIILSKYKAKEGADKGTKNLKSYNIQKNGPVFIKNLKAKSNATYRDILLKTMPKVYKKFQFMNLMNHFNKYKTNVKVLNDKDIIDKIRGTYLKKVTTKSVNPDKLRSFGKWKQQIKEMEIYDLKIKLLQSQGGRNEAKNKKLMLSRRFNKWKVNTIADYLLEKKKEGDKQREALLAKESGARLLKNLKTHIEKNDQDRQKKNVFNKIREVIILTKYKAKEGADKGTTNLKSYNIQKNGPVFIKNLKAKSNATYRDILLKTMPKVYKKFQFMNLMNHFNKYKTNVKVLNDKDIIDKIRGTYLKKVTTKSVNPDKLRTFGKWKQQIKEMEIYDLKIKLLQAQGGRNEGKNRKLMLSRRFNKWKVNTIADMLEEKKKERDRQRDALLAKESGARLLKNLRAHIEKNDQDRQKKNVFNKIREVIILTKYKAKEGADKGTINLKNYNIQKNGPVFLKNLKAKSNATYRNILLKTMPKVYKKFQYMNLMNHFNKYRTKVQVLNDKDIIDKIRANYLKSVCGKRVNPDQLRGFNKWLKQVKEMEIYDLKIKLLQAQGGRNEAKNRKLILSRRFNKWKVNTIADLLEEKKRERDRLRDLLLQREAGARLLRNIRKHLDKADEDNFKRKILNIWLDQVNLLKDKDRENYDQAADSIKRVNNLKNGPQLLDTLKGKSKLKRKKALLKKMPPRYKKYERINLLHYFLKWKLKAQALSNQAHRKKIRNTLVRSVLKKSDKGDMMRAFTKWKNTPEDKTNKFPIIVGTEQLHRALARAPFKHLCKVTEMMNLKIPHGMSLSSALIRMNKNVAKSIALRNMAQRPYFHKWKMVTRHLSGDELRKDMFNKLMLPNLNKNRKLVMRHAFRNWKDVVDLMQSNDLKKNLYMKLMGKMYDRGAKIALRRMFNLWKENYLDYIKRLNDAGKATYRLRALATRPILNKFRVAIMGQGKFDKVKAMMINALRKNDLGNLAWCFSKWRKATQLLRELSIKARLLRNLAKHQDYKNDDIRKNKLLETLLKWRIKCAPNDTWKKIDLIRQGTDRLMTGLRVPHNRKLFDGIAERAKNSRGNSLLYELLRRLNPRLMQIMKKNAFNTWLSKLGDTARMKKKFRRMVEDFTDGDRYYEEVYGKPAREIAEMMKAYYQLRMKKARPIHDFCRGLLNIKRMMEKMKTQLLLKKLVGSLGIFGRIKARLTLNKWNRNAKLKGVSDDAKAIQEFIRSKLGNTDKKLKRIKDGADHLDKYIKKKVLDRIQIVALENAIRKALFGCYRDKEAMNKKILRNYFNRWRDIIPLLREEEAAIKIQSAARGFKSRRKVNRMKDLNRRIKYMVLKLMGKDADKLNLYFNKWLAQLEKMNMKKHADTINNFLAKHLNSLKNRKAKENLADLFRKYVVRSLTDGMKKASKVRGDRGAVLYETLENIYIRRPYNKLINAMQWISRIKTIRKLQPRIQRALRLYWLPFYMNKWYDNTVGERNRKLLRLQNWIRGRLALLRRKRDLNKQRLLSKFLTKLTNDEELKKKIPFKYWNRVAKYTKLNDQAGAIQKLWKGWSSRKHAQKALAMKKLQDLLRNSVKKNIADTITEANDKFAAPLRKTLRAPKKLDKRIATNNVIDFANDELRNKYLHLLLGDRAFLNARSILRRYFDRWKSHNGEGDYEATRIQAILRGKLGRNRYKKMLQIKEKLYTLIMMLSQTDEDKMRSGLRRWCLKNRILKCDENSRIIQNFISPRLKKLLNEKFKNFFLNGAKKLVKRRLNNAAKVNNLKNALLKININEFLKRLQNKDRWDKLRWILAKQINAIDGSLASLILKRYFELWRKKAHKISDLLERSALLLQTNYRTLLAKLFVNKLRRRKQKLLNIILNLTNDNELKKKVAFNLWRHNAKLIAVDENSRIIQNFVGSILDKLRNKKDRAKLKNISKGLDILSQLKLPYRLGYNAIKSESNRKLFTKFNDDLAKKRRDHLKYAYDAIRQEEMRFLLNRLFGIPESGRKRILKKFIERWNDKANKIARKHSAEMIQRNYRLYILRKKYNNLNKRIKDLLLRLADKYNDILAYYFNKWRANANKKKVLRAGRKINKFVDNKLKDARAKKNWHKLADLLNLHNGNYEALRLLDRIRKFAAIDRLVKPIKYRFKKDGWDQFMDGYRYKLLQDKLRLLFTNFDKAKQLNSMKYYLRLWRNKAMRLKAIEDALNKAYTAVDNRRMIISADTLNNAFLVKKLFHDIPRARALDFFDRLREISAQREKMMKIGNNLLRAKNDLVDKNKDNFARRLYRIYIYVLLDKMYNSVNKLKGRLYHHFGDQLFDRLKALMNKGEDFNYNGSKSGKEKECPKTKLSFRAHVVNPKQMMMRDEETKDIIKIIMPYFNDYLSKKFRARKQFAMDKLKDNDRAGRFCKLYKTFANKKMLPPKQELYDKLKRRSDYIDSYGDHIIKLFKLLRKYFVHKACEGLTEPSRIYRLLYLIKLSLMHKNIAKQRFIREVIRKWRFSSFVKRMARRKLELMYKNLHLSYLQMANEVFGDEDSVNPSIIQEFERFGNGIGMFVNEDPSAAEEVKYCKGVSKKYIFEPVVIEDKKEITEDNNDFYVDQEIEGATTGKYKSETNKTLKKVKK